eukprot:CAMPEP_0179252352 /NCGR_PEP_ID=MMETSP0797-20121207/22172_1 /TAXON_ID=47934 /ORGANISM="Dinophysis acuminata, Strain DAEP01" /LENGTH=125 /DNA_ID=CAMNT_0020960183 /DNA_START=81 /DNA_END=458 /DNA_ORIENTATION=+
MADFSFDDLVSDATGKANIVTGKTDLSKAKMAKPPLGWSAAGSIRHHQHASELEAARKEVLGNRAGFKGVDEGGDGQLSVDAPALPFRMKHVMLIPIGLQAPKVVQSISIPNSKNLSDVHLHLTG